MRSSPFANFLLLFIIFQLLFGSTRLQEIFRNPLPFAIYLLALLIALVIHEFSHALAADRLGDPNPRLAGRLSLNPLKHLDPLGTLLIIIVGFGWGKPVAFDPYNLKDPPKDGALIAAAGPLSNLLLAIVSVTVLKYLALPTLAAFFLSTLISLNLILALFNLLPFYPLDGHHILRAFFPSPLRARYDLFNRHFGGFLTLIFLFIPIFQGQTLASLLLNPALNFTQTLLGLH